MHPSHAVRMPEPDFEDVHDAWTESTPSSPPPAARRTSAAAARAPVRLAVSVETVFAGTSVITRLLPAAQEDRRARGATRFLIAGAALLTMAVAMFVAITVKTQLGHAALDDSIAAGHGRATFGAPVPTGEARLLDGLFVGALLGGGLLVSRGLHRLAPGRHARRRSFVIGATGDADAPVDPSFISGAAHELVTPAGDDYLVHPTSRMTGLVEAGGQTYALTELGAEPGATFRLPPGAQARLGCGRTVFMIRSYRLPAPLPRPPRGPDAAEVPYAIGAVVALGLFVLMIFTIPLDPRSLTFDFLGGSSRPIAFHTMPPADSSVVIPVPHRSREEETLDGGPRRPVGPSGAMGDRHAELLHQRGQRLGASAGRRDTRGMGRENPGYARTAGILGVLEGSHDSDVESVWRGRSGFGDASGKGDVLGNLVGTQVGSAWGVGGLDSVGTGAGGGGTGEAGIGFGYLATVGSRGGPAGGSGYDHGVGRLGGRRRTVTPDVIVGEDSVRGSLDKEIVRRIVHRHLNEVRFCYEEQLVRQPHLGGRVGVQFTISSTGHVIASVLQSSTLASRAVENCTVNAVRRWEFPQPRGGGLVMVSYPFLFTPPL